MTVSITNSFLKNQRLLLILGGVFEIQSISRKSFWHKSESKMSFDRPNPEYLGFHAHIYYEKESFAAAQELVQKVKEALPWVEVGTMWQQNVGPHMKWSCQLHTSVAQFPELLYWLVRNRGTLTIFAHVLTGNDLYDHTQGVLWLGTSVPLNLSIFSV
jgi:DOPA 4,5-dioxygenase